MQEKVKVSVGDEIMVSLGYGYRKVIKAIVTKVGRVWIETNHNDRFRLDTQTDGSNYGNAPRFWTMKQWESKKALDAARLFLREQGIGIVMSGNGPWVGREIELAKIIKDYEKGES
jgi:hypothetical protein